MNIFWAYLCIERNTCLGSSIVGFGMLVIHIHLEKGSKPPLLVSGATFLLSSLVSLLCLSQFCIRSWLLSADWLAHPSEDKVLKWGQHANACTSEQGNTWDHMQTQTCTLKNLTCTKLHAHTDTHRRANLTCTQIHTSTHIQSPAVLCLPNLHLINPYVRLTKQERALSSLWTQKLIA